MASPEKKIIAKLIALPEHFHSVGERTGRAVHGHGQHVRNAADKFDEEEKKLAADAEKKLETTATKDGEKEAEAAAAGAAERTGNGKGGKPEGGKAKTPKPKLQPGTPEHREDRWKKYEKKINSAKYKRDLASGKIKRGPLSRQGWDNNYDVNMDKAKKAQAEVEDFARRSGHLKEDGWKFGNPGEEHEIKFPDGKKRRLDITNPGERVGIEYKGGEISSSKKILHELEMDGRLTKKGWDIRWVGQTEKPPDWLKPHLDKHGIKWHYDGDRRDPFTYSPPLNLGGE